MAREWEVSPTEQFDPRAVDRGYYRRYSRRIEAKLEREFNPAELGQEDLRSGDTRRFLLDDGYGDLDEVLDVKNSFEGLVE